MFTPALFILLVLSIGNYSDDDAIIKVNTVIKGNDIVEYNNQPLILIDFWATWCAPCRPATKQIEIYQNSHKEDFFAVAISDERYSTITNYLEHTPIALMVLQDQEMYNFTMHAVQSRPYAVLMNREGRVLWRGHPGNLTSPMIKNFANANRRSEPAELDDILSVNVTVEDRIAVDRMIVLERDNRKSETMFIMDEQEVKFIGQISELLAIALQIAPQQISIKPEYDISIEFTAPVDFWEYSHSTAVRVLNEFSLVLDIEYQEMKVHELQVLEASKLWDTSQIDWGEYSVGYLVGRDELQADNHSIRQLATLLSKVKNEVFIYDGAEINQHDWSFNFRDDEKMIAELFHDYGIRIQQKENAVPVYTIRK